MKRISIPLRAASLLSDYACPDGEVAASDNLLTAGQADGSSGTDSDGSAPSPFRLETPPAPDVEFALKRSVLQGWHIHPETFPSQIIGRGEASESGWGKMAVQLLARFEKDVRNGNLFFEPFFVLAALRLKDGSRVMPSSPVLMIPNSGAPIVSGTDNFEVETMKMDVVAAVCGLQWRVRVTEELKKQEDVCALEIFVSEGIAMYSRKGDALGLHREECLNFTHSVGTDGTSEEHRVATERIVQGWRPEAYSGAEIMRAILDTVDFYPVSEIPLDRLESKEEFEDVVFNCGGVSVMTAYTPYRPDFMHLSKVDAAGGAMISGRMTIWDLTIVSPLPRPLGLTAPYSTAVDYVPRWVFHPDPEAKSYRYAVGGEARELPLRRHPRFYGSYYWGGMDGDIDAGSISPETPSIESRTVVLPGAVWRSVKDNGLLFPDSLLMKPDVGRMIAVCRAFRASGLVATTSPTVYAFTSEGVYLLKEMDDGTFRDAGLICRYVLRDSGSYVMKGRSVVFTTEDGDVMEIDGTVVKRQIGGDTAGSATSGRTGISLCPVDENRKCSLATRPLKLGDAESWKRVLSVSLRGDFDPDKSMVSLYGSADLRRWRKIAERRGSEICGIWASPCRYFRLEAEVEMKAGESVQGIGVMIHNA